MPHHTSTLFRETNPRGSRDRKSLNALYYRRDEWQEYLFNELHNETQSALRSSSDDDKDSRDVQEFKQFFPFESAHPSSRFAHASKKAYPSRPVKQLCTPFQMRRRGFSPGKCFKGNDKSPRTFWNNGKLTKRCMEKYEMQRFCKSMETHDVVFEQKHEQKHKRVFVLSKAQHYWAYGGTVELPEKTDISYLGLTLKRTKQNLRVFWRTCLKYSILNYQCVFFSPDFLVVCKHPVYYVINGRGEGYSFYFKERISYFPMCKDTQEVIQKFLMHHISQTDITNIIFSYCLDLFTFYTSNFTLDLKCGVAHSEQKTINLFQSKKRQLVKNKTLW